MESKNNRSIASSLLKSCIRIGPAQKPIRIFLTLQITFVPCDLSQKKGSLNRSYMIRYSISNSILITISLSSSWVKKLPQIAARANSCGRKLWVVKPPAADYPMSRQRITPFTRYQAATMIPFTRYHWYIRTYQTTNHILFTSYSESLVFSADITYKLSRQPARLGTIHQARSIQPWYHLASSIWVVQ